MPIVVQERHRSRTRTEAVDPNAPTAELLYWAHGSDDDDAVKAAVEAVLPALHAGRKFVSYTMEPQGGGLWYVTARYQARRAPGVAYSFELSAGTARITQSIATPRSYQTLTGDYDIPDNKGAIGATDDTVEGCDVFVGAQQRSETWLFEAGEVTEALIETWENLNCHVNDATWRGRAKGEVLFLGVTGSSRDGNGEVTFRYAVKRNRDDVEVGDMVGMVKEGWEHMEIRYAPDVDGASNTRIQRAVNVIMHQVYPYGDLTQLGIGT